MVKKQTNLDFIWSRLLVNHDLLKNCSAAWCKCQSLWIWLPAQHTHKMIGNFTTLTTETISCLGIEIFVHPVLHALTSHSTKLGYIAPIPKWHFNGSVDNATKSGLLGLWELQWSRRWCFSIVQDHQVHRRYHHVLQVCELCDNRNQSLL